MDYDWFDFSELESAEHVGGYRVFVTFRDGTAAEIDLAPVLDFEGVFRELRDERRFAAFRVEDTLVWSDQLDIAPETIYHLARGRRLPSEIPSDQSRS